VGQGNPVPAGNSGTHLMTRAGAFVTGPGLCGGRLTSSRWGIWASDGRLGAGRVPAQQLESLARSWPDGPDPAGR